MLLFILSNRQQTCQAKFDGFVESPKLPISVIPAKAGIQHFQMVIIIWTPVFTEVTTFYETAPRKKLIRAELNASAFSMFDRCFAADRIVNFDPGIFSRIAWDADTGVPGSSSPTRMNEGVFMAGRRSK
jgi:hypothetical protein